MEFFVVSYTVGFMFLNIFFFEQMKNKKPDEAPKPASEKPAEEEKEEGEIQSKGLSMKTDK
jgi:hypothetical protein